MKLLEYEGKALFAKYGISIPAFFRVTLEDPKLTLAYPFMLKSQVPVGNRKEVGGIVLVKNENEFQKNKEKLFKLPIAGFIPESLLAETLVEYDLEIYVSFSFDTETQGSVLALSKRGGTGINEAQITPIDILAGISDSFIIDALNKAGISHSEYVITCIHALWRLFEVEHALLAEINPLFIDKKGNVTAGDAKVVLDDNISNPQRKSFLQLDGDIAIIASGGGASMLNLDILTDIGGKPANYVEYSGNPQASMVEALTIEVLSQKKLKGCWVVGGIANFTDIFETMSGFISGLKKINPKPQYPIVIRRDGPRQEEAYSMLRDIAKTEGYNFHLYGSEVSMAESAKILIDVMNKHEYTY